MNSRRLASVVCLASLALLLSFLAVPTASAEKPGHAPCGPINAEGPWLEIPGGGYTGGDGGDADEFLLDSPSDRAPQIVSDERRNPAGEPASVQSLLRIRVWWRSFLFWAGIIR